MKRENFFESFNDFTIGNGTWRAGIMRGVLRLGITCHQGTMVDGSNLSGAEEITPYEPAFVVSILNLCFSLKDHLHASQLHACLPR